jgi:hypothetical protein
MGSKGQSIQEQNLLVTRFFTVPIGELYWDLNLPLIFFLKKKKNAKSWHQQASEQLVPQIEHSQPDIRDLDLRHPSFTITR